MNEWTSFLFTLWNHMLAWYHGASVDPCSQSAVLLTSYFHTTKSPDKLYFPSCLIYLSSIHEEPLYGFTSDAG